MAKAKAKKPQVASEKKETKGLVLVQFNRSFTPYVKGEVAGFEKDYAEQLIKKDIATPFKK